MDSYNRHVDLDLLGVVDGLESVVIPEVLAGFLSGLFLGFCRLSVGTAGNQTVTDELIHGSEATGRSFPRPAAG